MLKLIIYNMLYLKDKKALAYIIGIALGDGNLSNPNKRAVRLRITCDSKYPKIIEDIKSSLKIIAPENKISLINKKDTATDISCYSNDWEKVLGWKVGSKIKQNVKIPDWIKMSSEYKKECLRGLLQTDGSIYKDKSYTMINFVSHIEKLAFDTLFMIQSLGFKPTVQILDVQKGQKKYTIRLAKNSLRFIEEINLYKS
jgi:DNA-binding transcriptional regulator WhiA